jgi:DNA-binding CsgD family transcriptional regulator
MDHFSKAPGEDISPAGRLSERQKQCLELVASGHTSKQIARQLNLSPSTVDNHLNAALERLGVDSRALAARIFVQGNQRSKVHAEHDAQDAYRGFSEPRISKTGQSFMASLLSIPPVGGKENELSQRRRYYHVIQIMILALMAFSAVTVTIAGMVHLFSK